MTDIARAARHHVVMAEIEKASRHDARIDALAEQIKKLLPASREELAEALGVKAQVVDHYLKELRLAEYKIIVVGKNPNYKYEMDYE